MEWLSTCLRNIKKAFREKFGEKHFICRREPRATARELKISKVRRSRMKSVWIFLSFVVFSAQSDGQPLQYRMIRVGVWLEIENLQLKSAHRVCTNRTFLRECSWPLKNTKEKQKKMCVLRNYSMKSAVNMWLSEWTMGNARKMNKSQSFETFRVLFKGWLLLLRVIALENLANFQEFSEKSVSIEVLSKKLRSKILEWIAKSFLLTRKFSNWKPNNQQEGSQQAL